MTLTVRLLCLLTIAAALALAGCADTTTEPAADNASAAAGDDTARTPASAGSDTGPGAKNQEQAKPRPQAGTALAALDRLAVKGRAPKTGYDRDQFGSGWASVNGCDTRQRILARDLDNKLYEPGENCEITSGALSDPYTATRIQFVRGGASEVDIDHVVALGDAWQKGAQTRSYDQRVQFANDPLNLLSAQASANRQKSDSDAASWLPSNKSFRCSYVARQIAVKTRYKASVTGAERAAMSRVLGACPKQQLPTAARVRVPVKPRNAPTPEPTATPKPASNPNSDGQAQQFAKTPVPSAMPPTVAG